MALEITDSNYKGGSCRRKTGCCRFLGSLVWPMQDGGSYH